MRASSGSDTAGLVADDPQQPDGALLGVAEDLHRVGRRRPVRDDARVDVPQLGELVRRGRRCPSCGSRAGRRRRRIPVVLRGRLAVHLQDAAARAAEHAAQQVQVVDLARRRRSPGGTGRSPAGRWRAPLGACRRSARPRAMSSGRRRRRSRPTAPVCTAATCSRSSSKPTVCASMYVLVDPAVADELADQAVHQRQVGAGRAARCTSALACDRRLGAGRRTTSRGGSGPSSRSSIRIHSTVWVSAMLWPYRNDRVAVHRCRCRSPGWPSQPKVSFSAAAAVAVHSRVLPSMWGVPIRPCR